MPYTITAFANKTNPTGPQLDNNFNAAALEMVTPCSVSGTNDISLTQKANTYTISAYEQNLQISGVAAASNNAATRARLGALAFLKVYRDTPAGPVQCTGNEIIIGNAFTLMYDASLDTGAGGWHLFTTTAVSGAFLPLTGGTLTGPVALTGSVGTVGFTTQLSATLMSGVSLNMQSPSITSVLFSHPTITSSVLMVGTTGTAASVTRMLSTIATVTFTVASANGTQDQTALLTGVQVRDSIALGMSPSLPAGAGYTGFVPAAGTVTVRQMNATAGTLASVTHTLRLTAIGAA